MTLGLFWWAEEPNFGDRISRDIVAHVAGQDVDWAPPAKADLISTGSIMYAARKAHKSGRKTQVTLWGTGAMKPLRTDFVPHTTIAALRGPITRELLGVQTEVFGDPGLLLPWVLGAPIAKTDKIAVIPHWKQAEATAQAIKGLGDKIVMIDPRTTEHMAVVREIASCAGVFSSSLHGLIVADAFGVPNVWLDPAANHEFARLKFYDYGLGIGRAMPAPVGVEAIEGLLENGLPPIDYAGGIARAQAGLAGAFPAQMKGKNAPDFATWAASAHTELAAE